MKKLILVGMVVLLPAGLFAGEKDRIRELKAELEKRQQQAQQYQQALSQVNIRIVELRAIIGEYVREEGDKDERKRGEDTSD